MPVVQSLSPAIIAAVVMIPAGIVVNRLTSLSSSSSPPPQSSGDQRSSQNHRTSIRGDDRPSPPPVSSTSRKYDDHRRTELKRMAEETLTAIKVGYYGFKGVDQELSVKVKKAMDNTQFYAPDCGIVSWGSTRPAAARGSGRTHISVLNISTLDAARLLEGVYKTNQSERAKTGILNFASATSPGGGFRNGAEAQEESIARASTLYPTLCDTEQAAKFYRLHTRETRENQLAYYSHAIVYSPGVTVFRDDDGTWTYPFDVDVLSCAAVNAGEVRKATAPAKAPVSTEVGIEKEMAERMGRILYVFEKQGVRNLVLGTFGTGVFRNNVAIVARLWAHLLIVQDARFKDSFDRIIFAITGEETFAEFHSAFDAWGKERASGHGRNQHRGQPPVTENLIIL